MCQDCDLLIRRFPVGGISFSSPARRRTRKKACDAPRPEVPGCPRCAARAVRFSQEHLQAKNWCPKEETAQLRGRRSWARENCVERAKTYFFLMSLSPFTVMASLVPLAKESSSPSNSIRYRP